MDRRNANHSSTSSGRDCRKGGAAEAIEARFELAQMPGVDMKALKPTIKFLELVRDQSSAAASACAGANHTLAGALVAFRLLRNIGGEETEDHGKYLPC